MATSDGCGATEMKMEREGEMRNGSWWGWLDTLISSRRHDCLMTSEGSFTAGMQPTREMEKSVGHRNVYGDTGRQKNSQRERELSIVMLS